MNLDICLELPLSYLANILGIISFYLFYDVRNSLLKVEINDLV